MFEEMKLGFPTHKYLSHHLDPVRDEVAVTFEQEIRKISRS